MTGHTEHDFRSSTPSDDIESSSGNHVTSNGDGRAPLEKQSTAASGLSVFEYRAQSVVSRIRSREPGQTARFAHPLSHTKTSEDVIVDFDGPDDPYRPVNWGFNKKAVTTLLYGLTTMGATWASAIYSAGQVQVSTEFGVSVEVSTLGTALLLFGLGLGPLVWAPLSEVYGRKPAVLGPYFIATIFSFGSATAKDLQTLMLTRFFAGFFASAPITNTGGVLSDIFTPEERGAAIVWYAMAVVGGPVVGPIVGGAIVESYLGWRWTEYVSLLFESMYVPIPNSLDHRNHDDVLPPSGRHLRRRELSPSTPSLQSATTPLRKRQLGTTRAPRRMGRDLERTGQQIPDPTIQVTGHTNLLPSCTIRLLRLRHPLPKSIILPHRIPTSPKLEPSRRRTPFPSLFGRHHLRRSHKPNKPALLYQSLQSKQQPTRTRSASPAHDAGIYILRVGDVRLRLDSPEKHPLDRTYHRGCHDGFGIFHYLSGCTELSH